MAICIVNLAKLVVVASPEAFLHCRICCSLLSRVFTSWVGCTVGKDADEETGGGDGVSSAVATTEPSELAQEQPASAVEVSQFPTVKYRVIAK